MPVGVERLEVRRIDPDAIVWRGNRDIPTEQQGLKILGCPVGHHDFVQDQLSKLADRHSVLLDRISLVDDLQSAWLLLVFCAAARANFFLRSVTPGQTSAYQMWSCLCNLLELSPASVLESSRMATTLPLRLRFGPQQRREVETCGPLGKLGGLHRDDAPETSHRCPDHHRGHRVQQPVPHRSRGCRQHGVIARSWIHDPFMGRVDPGGKPASPCGGGRPFSATVWSAAGGSSCSAPHFLGKRLKRLCSVLKAALWLLSPSPVCLQCARPPSTLNRFGCSCSVVSASLSPSLHAGAGVAVHSTALARGIPWRQ